MANLSSSNRNTYHLFFLMFIQYAVLTFNTRAITSANYIGLFITDLIVAWLGVTILKKINEAITKREMAAYMFGGAIGAQVALFAGLYLFGAA